MITTVILCLLLKLSLSCETQLNNYHDDYFFVTTNSSDCTTFNFIKCEYSSCYKASSGTNGNGNCHKGSVTTYYSWSECLSSLCDMSEQPQTYQTIQNCYDANKKSFLLKLGLGLGFGLLFFVGITVTIIVCYCKHKNNLSFQSCCLVEKCNSCCSCCKRFPDDQSENEVTIQMEKKLDTLR